MGGNSLTVLLSRVHTKLLDARSAEYLANSAEFRSAWVMASDELREEILSSRLDRDIIKEWIIKVRCTDIDTMPGAQLLKLASKLKIKNYSRTPRDELRMILKARIQDQ